MNTDKFLSVTETQLMLKSSKKFVYIQVRKGKLTLFKVGHRSYFKESEVNALFQPKIKQAAA